VFPEEAHLPRQQPWVGICILINTFSEGSNANKTKHEGAQGSNLVFFVWTNIFNLSFLLEMMKPWQSTIQESTQQRQRGERKYKEGGPKSEPERT
jgi:hypothetical protein